MNRLESYTLLECIVLHFSVRGPTFQEKIVCCSALQCVTVCCSVLQCVAVCCSVLQCVAVCCSVLFLIFFCVAPPF